MATSPAANEPVRRGASDLLRIAPSDTGDEASHEFELLREHIANHGDRMLHFSAEVVEIVDSTPTTRVVVVTDRALYKFPTSVIQTGLFFDARFALEKLVQVVAVDNDDKLQGHGLAGLDAQIYISSDSGNTILAFTLNFSNFPARRQAFFLSLSLVKSGLPILLKRRVQDQQQAAAQQQQAAEEQTPASAFINGQRAKSPVAGSANKKPGSKPVPHYMTATKTAFSSPNPKLPSSSFGSSIKTGNASPPGGGTSRSIIVAGADGVNNNNSAQRQQQQQQQQNGGDRKPSSYSPAAFRDGVSASADNNHLKSSTVSTTFGSSTLPPAGRELTAEEYERQRKQLHVLLMFDLSPANQLDMLDPGWRSANRPPEENIERINERDEVRAMIYAREDKIELDARFREKNPKKALTKFARGVCLEFDKAHEERFVPPELSDEMLLGPALFPLWKQWKLSGGLLKVDRNGHNDDEDHPWTLFDTNDLISSIRAQEDALLGQIGKKSMVRLQQMRELVEREKKMFMNRRAATKKKAAAGGGRGGSGDDDYDTDSDDSSPSGTRGARSPGKMKTTRPVPFRLSCSPNLERQVKRSKPEVLDLGQVMKTMKDGLMVHRAKLHELQKTQLVREINRHVGM